MSASAPRVPKPVVVSTRGAPPATPRPVVPAPVASAGRVQPKASGAARMPAVPAPCGGNTVQPKVSGAARMPAVPAPCGGNTGRTVQPKVAVAPSAARPAPPVPASRGRAPGAPVAPGILQRKVTRAEIDRDLTKDESKLFEQWMPARAADEKHQEIILDRIADVPTLKRILGGYAKHLAAEAQDPGESVDLGKKVDALLCKSKIVGKYITRGMKKGLAVHGNMTALGDAQFFEAYADSAGVAALKKTGKAASGSMLKAGVTINGVDLTEAYTDPNTNKITFRKGLVALHTAIHEGLHLYSSPSFKESFGKDMDEGTTETLARLVCQEHDIPTNDIYYVEQRKFIAEMMAGAELSLKELVDAYFGKTRLTKTDAIPVMIGKIRPWIKAKKGG